MVILNFVLYISILSTRNVLLDFCLLATLILPGLLVGLLSDTYPSEMTLLGAITSLHQTVITLGRDMLLLGNNRASLFVLNEVILLQSTRSLKGSSVKNLAPAANQLLVGLTTNMVLAISSLTMILHYILTQYFIFVYV